MKNKKDEIKKLKEQHRLQYEKAIQNRVEELQNIGAVDGLEKQIMCFTEDPYEDETLYFDDCGMLCAFTELSLGEIAEEDTDVIETILERLSDNYGGWYVPIQKSIRREWEFHQCLGEATIINESPERNHYAVYSDELGLKVDQIVNETHGFAIVEQAMRDAEVFPSVVTTDYYGTPELLELPDHIRQGTTDYLRGMIDAFDSVIEDCYH